MNDVDGYTTQLFRMRTARGLHASLAVHKISVVGGHAVNSTLGNRCSVRVDTHVMDFETVACQSEQALRARPYPVKVSLLMFDFLRRPTVVCMYLQGQGVESGFICALGVIVCAVVQRPSQPGVWEDNPVSIFFGNFSSGKSSSLAPIRS